MAQETHPTRRDFLSSSIAAGAVSAAVAMGTSANQTAAAAPAVGDTGPRINMPQGTLGKTKISRLLLGGNLIGGWLHGRDLKYLGSLFRAYVTEQKMMETLALAEQCGINTVFETGHTFINRYNREFNGKMQFIPHIKVFQDQAEAELKDHIKYQVDTGACALYVWGVAGDQLASAGRIDLIARAVELAKKHNLPVGVGGHSLQVPVLCEKEKVPCDFYVKTLHNDDYPSATPKAQRKDFMWLTGAPGWYDNMWCINVEETIQFMKSVEKPWIAFKILAAGAYVPRDGFTFAVKNGADFIAVGMFDFQIRENAGVALSTFKAHQQRERPWRA